MAIRPKCFLSHTKLDNDFVYGKIIPILEALNIDLLIANEKIIPSLSIPTRIITELTDSDIIISILNRRSFYFDFEMGVAAGSNKPIIAITDDPDDSFARNLKYLHYLFYDDYKNFAIRLRATIEKISETVIDKTTFSYNSTQKIIGISVGSGSKDFATQLSFTYDFIDFIKYITEYPNINLIQISKGSLKSIISLDLKSWAQLVEKILFFLPELKKRKLDRLSIEANIRKIDAETNQIKSTIKIREAEAFLDIAERYQNLGFKIQIDEDLLILQSQDGQLTFKQPPRLE